MRSDERRRHVRIRPLPELPAKLVRTDLEAEEVLEVFDLSIGGLGLVTRGSIAEMSRGQRLDVRIDLGRYGTFPLVANVRYVGEALTGCELDELPPGYVAAVGRFIAELLERGAPS